MKRRSLFLAAALLLAPGSARTQEFATIVQLSLSNPGARSLALGGAFVALADDATAAFANPAGLVQLTQAEVSLEGRAWNYSTPFTRGGRAGGQPTGIGMDVTAGVVTDRSSAELSGLSFLSAVVPVGRWTLAVYRHQLANFEFSSETQSIFIDHPDGSIGTLLPRRGRFAVEAVSHAVAAGVTASETLWLGFGLSYYRVDVAAFVDIYFPDEAAAPEFEGVTYFGPSSFLLERQVVTSDVIGDDSYVGVNLGFLWRAPGGWQFGGSYRQGPTVEGESVTYAGPFNPQPAGTLLQQNAGSLSLPDVYALGVARHFLEDRLTLSFEWDWVQYSALNNDEDPRLDDGDELHLGIEYALLKMSPILAFRAGVWRDPDHSVRGPRDNPLLRAFYPPGDEELHYAVGLGVAARRFQIDLGVDLSELSDTASISGIFRF